VALKTVSTVGLNAGASALFGTGSDGDVTITGTVTLARDMNYRSLTVSGAGQLITNGYRVFVLDTLDITAAPAGAITFDLGLLPGVVAGAGLGALTGRRFRLEGFQGAGCIAKPQPAKPAPPQTAPGGFAPVRGPGALLGRLLKETYRQAPNIAANVVAIPAFTAAGAGGAYLGTAATVAAIRGIGKLFATPEEKKQPAEPLSLPAPAGQPDDYRTGFQRAIDDRRKPRPNDSGFDVIRGLSRTRGIS
jgi:hypothetical protein